MKEQNWIDTVIIPFNILQNSFKWLTPVRVLKIRFLIKKYYSQTKTGNSNWQIILRKINKIFKHFTRQQPNVNVHVTIFTSILLIICPDLGTQI